MLQVMVRETEIKQTSFDTIYAVKYSKNEIEIMVRILGKVSVRIDTIYAVISTPSLTAF